MKDIFTLKKDSGKIQIYVEDKNGHHVMVDITMEKFLEELKGLNL